MTHINRLLVVFSLLSAIMPVVAVSLLIHGARQLAAAMIWMAF